MSLQITKKEKSKQTIFEVKILINATNSNNSDMIKIIN